MATQKPDETLEVLALKTVFNESKYAMYMICVSVCFPATHLYVFQRLLDSFDQQNVYLDWRPHVTQVALSAVENLRNNMPTAVAYGVRLCCDKYSEQGHRGPSCGNCQWVYHTTDGDTWLSAWMSALEIQPTTFIVGYEWDGNNLYWEDVFEIRVKRVCII